MDNKSNALNWFEIPVADMKRAKAFYERIFGIDMGEVMDMGGTQMDFFPMGEGAVSGALTFSDMQKPSADGTTVYLNANPAGMEQILGRIPEAGGTVALPKTQITPEYGYMAFFMDPEGNKIGLHSDN